VDASVIDALAAAPALATTPRAILYEEAESRLYRFAPPAGPADGERPAVLIVPSLINRWYVVDLRPGASLVAGLLEGGLDVCCLDWGVAGDEDRHTTWDDLLRRLARAVRRTLTASGRSRLAMVGYCMGGTLAAIQTALDPAPVAGLVDLLGPIDFAAAGQLAAAVDARWFDAGAVSGAGNIAPLQIQSGFQLLRPTGQLARWVGLVDRIDDPQQRDSFMALETWASDNIPFPAAAYRTYIHELYQENALIAGRHRALGRLVSLSEIRCPTLCVVADRDTICPPAAASALLDRVSAEDRTLLTLRGGHVGAVVGSRAPRELYAPLSAWLRERLRA
jgi:polyhydroxyalkanoate synthase subunit PhaC